MNRLDADELEAIKVLEEKGFNLLAISGGIWATAPIKEEPSISLTQWKIKETTIGNFFSGWNTRSREGRVSTRIVTYDPETKRGITESGRVYELVGESGWNGDAEYVWARYKRIYNLVELTDVPVLDEVIDG